MNNRCCAGRSIGHLLLLLLGLVEGVYEWDQCSNGGLSEGEVRAQLGDFGTEMAMPSTEFFANTRRITLATTSAQDSQQTLIEQWPAHAPASRGPRARGKPIVQHVVVAINATGIVFVHAHLRRFLNQGAMLFVEA